MSYGDAKNPHQQGHLCLLISACLLQCSQMKHTVPVCLSSRKALHVPPAELQISESFSFYLLELSQHLCCPHGHLPSCSHRTDSSAPGLGGDHLLACIALEFFSTSVFLNQWNSQSLSTGMVSERFSPCSG